MILVEVVDMWEQDQVELTSCFSLFSIIIGSSLNALCREVIGFNSGFEEINLVVCRGLFVKK